MKELISTFCSLVVHQVPSVLRGNFLTFNISKDVSAVNRLVSSSLQLETIRIHNPYGFGFFNMIITL
jgi:hypothetical protein